MNAPPPKPLSLISRDMIARDMRITISTTGHLAHPLKKPKRPHGVNKQGGNTQIPVI
jgi:hypothetical protein